MRIALVHDWLTGMRGGERVLDEVLRLFPDAHVTTLIHVPGRSSPRIDAAKIHASWLSRIPGVAVHYRKLWPLMPAASRGLQVGECDLVLSTHHAFAKSVRRPPGIPHLCYCFTPLRYAWDQTEAYLGRGAVRHAARPALAALRRFDRRMARPDQVTRFAAVSDAVGERIRRHYGRPARTLYPPVDIERFRPETGRSPNGGRSPEDDYYLLVAALVPYKRVDVAIEAFRRLGRRLIIVGEGPARSALEGTAPRNVRFAGRVSDDALCHLYQGCRALVHPQEEDFGLCAVEAQACGRPVIALGRGGARESVRPVADEGSPSPTGVWFPDPTAESLALAVETFEKREALFDPERIRAWAERFSPERFARGLQREIEATLASAEGR